MVHEFEPQSDALRSLFDTYFRDDALRLAALERAAVNADVARLLNDLRDELNLSRDQLALRASVDPALIEDLEEGDYDGDSSAALAGIRLALGVNVGAYPPLSAAPGKEAHNEGFPPAR